MGIRVKFFLSTAAVVFLMHVFSLSICIATEFQADFTEQKGGKISRGKLYVKDSGYRLEREEGGKKIVVIVDQAKNITRVLDLKEKKYMQIKTGDFKSLSSDPFQTAKYIKSKYDTRVAGTEKISGFDCEKTESLAQGKVIMSQWTAKQLSFPVKIVQYQGNKEATIELSGIQAGVISESLLKTPQDFLQIEDPAVGAKTGAGEDLAKISHPQPGSRKETGKKPPVVKRAVKTGRSGSGGKSVQSFSVEFPTGSVKSVNPSKGLEITVVGTSPNAKGKILLYQDKNKKKKIDSFMFNLKQGQAKSWRYSKGMQVAKVSVWVMGGTFNVRLDQSK